jgi:hypothetical protein
VKNINTCRSSQIVINHLNINTFSFTRFMTGYRLGNNGPVLVTCIIFLLTTISKSFLRTTQLLWVNNRHSALKGKVPQAWNWTLISISAKIKISWSLTSTPLACLHGVASMHSNKFTSDFLTLVFFLHTNISTLSTVLWYTKE